MTRVLFLDVDGVVTAGSTEPVSREVVEALLALAEAGVHLVPLTGQDLANIEERFYADLIRRMPPAMRAVATAYTETGARCYIYDAAAAAMEEDGSVSCLFAPSDQERLRAVLERLRRAFALSTRGRDITSAWLSVSPVNPAQSEVIALRMIEELAREAVEAHVYLTATGDINAVRRTKAFGVADYMTRCLPPMGEARRVVATAVVDSVGRKGVEVGGRRVELQFNDQPIVETARSGVGGIAIRVINVGPCHAGFEVPDEVVQIGQGPAGLLKVLGDPAMLWGPEDSQCLRSSGCATDS